MFDPFDESNRDKKKRRSSQEVAADKRNWNDRIDRHFLRALEALGNPDYVDSEMINFEISRCEEKNLPMQVIRRNFEKAMERLTYEKYSNGFAKDGRWQFGKFFVFVYFKRGSARISKSELKQELGR